MAAGEVDDLVGALLVVEVVGVEAAALPLPVQAEDELVDEVAVVVTLQGVLRHHLPVAVVFGLLHPRPHLQLPSGEKSMKESRYSVTRPRCSARVGPVGLMLAKIRPR